MKNTELIHVNSGNMSGGTTSVKATKRLSRPFKIKSMLFCSAGAHIYTLQTRIFIGSPNTTDPINDPTCKEITSKLGSSEGIILYNVYPVVWTGLDIIVNQQDRAIIVYWHNENPEDSEAVVNFHLQMM